MYSKTVAAVRVELRNERNRARTMQQTNANEREFASMSVRTVLVCLVWIRLYIAANKSRATNKWRARRTPK